MCVRPICRTYTQLPASCYYRFGYDSNITAMWSLPPCVPSRKKKKKSRESKTQASLNMSSTCFFHHYTTKKLKTTTDTGNQIKLTGLQNIRWWCEKVLSLKLILGTGLSNVKQETSSLSCKAKLTWSSAAYLTAKVAVLSAVTVQQALPPQNTLASLWEVNMPCHKLELNFTDDWLQQLEKREIMQTSYKWWEQNAEKSRERELKSAAETLSSGVQTVTLHVLLLFRWPVRSVQINKVMLTGTGYVDPLL